MVRIKCLACGKAVKAPKFIDTDNYDGQVVCQECKSLLHVKLVKGKVQKYKIVASKFKDPNALNWLDLVKLAQEAEQREKAEREGTEQ